MTMILLNDTQVANVQAYLAQAGISEDLASELLDHLCCAIEYEMQHGSSFEESLKETLRRWPQPQLQALHKSIHFTTKTKPMLLKISSIAALLAGLAFLSPIPWPETTTAPVASVCSETIPLPHKTLASADFTFEPPTASPIAGVEMKDILSSGYGMRTHPLLKKRMHHRGIDLKAKTGTPVVATAPGEIVLAKDKGKFGLSVRIQHDDGYITFFAHLSKLDVTAGDRVLLGQQIGAVGSTGVSTAPHLHYEVWKDNRPIDPLALLD